MSRFLYRLPLLAAAMLLLAACAGQGVRPAGPGQAVIQPGMTQEDISGWFAAHPDWSFEGRVAVSQGRKGGSGRVDWRQQGRQYTVELSAPITRQSWRLSGDTHYEAGTLEGMEGGIRHGEDAEVLLQEATGWAIPVNLLPDWVRGLPVWDTSESAQVSYAVDGRPQSMQQLGWTIEYRDWHPAIEGRPARPRRIEARNGEAQVKLLVDRWDFAAP